VVTSRGDSTVSVLVGNGNGTVQSVRGCGSDPVVTVGSARAQFRQRALRAIVRVDS
jgi:hypothetical protein